MICQLLIAMPLFAIISLFRWLILFFDISPLFCHAITPLRHFDVDIFAAFVFMPRHFDYSPLSFDYFIAASPLIFAAAAIDVTIISLLPMLPFSMFFR
jgi:hypothetical protein